MYCDLRDEGDAGIGPPVGIVESTHAKVRRRAARSYLWTFVEPDSPLGKKDAIQTAEESSATVRLKNGSQLEIGENSLVVMDDTAQLSLQFLRGSFTLRKNEGDSLITVGSNGQTNLQKLPLRLLSPEQQATISISPSESRALVKFTWAAAGEASPLTEAPTIQISKAPDFAPKYTRLFPLKSARDTSFQTRLEPGVYFWRVVSKGSPVSEALRLTLTRVNPLIPIFPTEGEKLRWEADKGVEFRWTLPDTLGSTRALHATHEIEVAKDPGFKQIVKKETVSALAEGALLASLGEGDFFWRIRSRYRDVTLTSDVEPFSLSKIVLDNRPLTLLTPADDDKIFYWSAPKAFSFTWRKESLPEEGGYSYRLEVARDPEFKTGLVSRQTKTATLSSQSLSLPTSDYYWRVKLTDASGNAVKTSSAAKFAYGLHPILPAPMSLKPRTGTLINLIEAKTHPALSWEPVPDAVAYEVTVKSKEKNKIIFHKQTEKTWVSLKDLPVGYYEWTVSAIDPIKRPGEPALWMKFSASYGKPLSAPRVLSDEVQ